MGHQYDHLPLLDIEPTAIPLKYIKEGHEYLYIQIGKVTLRNPSNKRKKVILKQQVITVNRIDEGYILFSGWSIYDTGWIRKYNNKRCNKYWILRNIV